MKPILLIVSIFFICSLISLILPQLGRVSLPKAESLPVSVTAIAPSAQTLQMTSGQLAENNLAASNDVSARQMPGLKQFIASVRTGIPGQVAGVYVPGLFALPVKQQPVGQPDFVDRENNVLTQFGLPKKYGSTGLLAHNFLSGSQFFNLKNKQDVIIIYGDGAVEHYRISRIESFQALKPESPFSDFVDLSDPNHSVLTSAGLFNRVYTTNHQVVFQTCIDNDGEPSWGRMFVIATLADPLSLAVPQMNYQTSSN